MVWIIIWLFYDQKLDKGVVSHTLVTDRESENWKLGNVTHVFYIYWCQAQSLIIFRFIFPALISWSLAPMGFHTAIVATTLKLKALSTSHSTLMTPLLTGLICPFVLKLSFSFGLVHQTYSDLIHQSRLFFFQLNEIAAADNFDDDLQQQQPAATRLQRALRLLQQAVTHQRNSQASELDEQSIHDLSMVALWAPLHLHVHLPYWVRIYK